MSLPSCSVCISHLKPSDNVCAVACGHVFHYNCIAEWVNRCGGQGQAASCPTCKQPVNFHRSCGTIHKLYFQYDGVGKSREVRALEAKLEAEISKGRQEKTNLLKRLDRTVELHYHKEVIASYEQEIKIWNKSKAELTSKCETLSVTLSSFKKFHDDQIKMVDALMLKMKTSEQSLKKANVQNDKMKQRIQELEETVSSKQNFQDSLTSWNSALSASNTRKIGRIADLKIRIRELEETVALSAERNKNTEASLFSLHKAHESLKVELKNTQGAKNQTDVKFEWLNRQMYESEAAFASLKKDHDALRENLTALEEESFDERKRLTAHLNHLELDYARSIAKVTKECEDRIVKERELSTAKQKDAELVFACSIALVTKDSQDRIVQERKRSTAKLNDVELVFACSIAVLSKYYENRIVQQHKVATAKQDDLELAYARSFATATKAFEDRIVFRHLDRALNATEGHDGLMRDIEPDFERRREEHSIVTESFYGSATGEIPAKTKVTFGVLPKPETKDVISNRDPSLTTGFHKKPIAIQEMTMDDVSNPAKDTLPGPRDSGSRQIRFGLSVFLVALLFVLKIPGFIILSFVKTFLSLRETTML